MTGCVGDRECYRWVYEGESTLKRTIQTEYTLRSRGRSGRARLCSQPRHHDPERQRPGQQG
jgi:hypothetical protein